MLRSNKVLRVLNRKPNGKTDQLGLCGVTHKVPGTRPPFTPPENKSIEIFNNFMHETREMTFGDKGTGRGRHWV